MDEPKVAPWKVFIMGDFETPRDRKKYLHKIVTLVSLIVDWVNYIMPGDLIEVVDKDTLAPYLNGYVSFVGKRRFGELSWLVIHRSLVGRSKEAIREYLKHYYSEDVTDAEPVAVIAIQVEGTSS